MFILYIVPKIPGKFFVNFHGPTIKSNNAFYGSVEDAKVSFIDIRDIAAIVVKTLTDNGNYRHNDKVYTITSPEALSHYQVAEILSNATTKTINYVDIPEEEFQLRKKLV